MALIRIREQTIEPDGAHATVSFDDEGEYPVTICDPFSEEEEQLLEWYFERYLRFPFLRQVDAQAAAANIPRYGETLFGQVFADPEAYSAYTRCRQAGLTTLHAICQNDWPLCATSLAANRQAHRNMLLSRYES